LIYYPDGNSGLDFHSDHAVFGDTSIIPSVSLGEEREFKFREKESGNEITTTLESGSLIIMGKHCQERYEHRLPINPESNKPRINLTFRKYGFSNRSECLIKIHMLLADIWANAQN
jgi:alkylated DNA repair dioxygenase AlkB